VIFFESDEVCETSYKDARESIKAARGHTAED